MIDCTNITNRHLKIQNAKAARESLRAMERFIMVAVVNNDPFDDKCMIISK